MGEYLDNAKAWARQHVECKVTGGSGGLAAVINAAAELPLPPLQAFQLMAHPDNAAIFRGIECCTYRRILWSSPEGDGRQKVEVENASDWHFMCFKGCIRMRMVVDEDPVAGTIHVRLAPGGNAPLQYMQAWWTFAPGATPGSCLVSLEQEVQPKGIAPMFYRAFRAMAGSQLRQTFEDLYAEALRMNAGQPVLAPYASVAHKQVGECDGRALSRGPSLAERASSLAKRAASLAQRAGSMRRVGSWVQRDACVAEAGTCLEADGTLQRGDGQAQAASAPPRAAQLKAAGRKPQAAGEDPTSVLAAYERESSTSSLGSTDSTGASSSHGTEQSGGSASSTSSAARVVSATRGLRSHPLPAGSWLDLARLASLDVQTSMPLPSFSRKASIPANAPQLASSLSGGAADGAFTLQPGSSPFLAAAMASSFSAEATAELTHLAKAASVAIQLTAAAAACEPAACQLPSERASWRASLCSLAAQLWRAYDTALCLAPEAVAQLEEMSILV